MLEKVWKHTGTCVNGPLNGQTVVLPSRENAFNGDLDGNHYVYDWNGNDKTWVFRSS